MKRTLLFMLSLVTVITSLVGCGKTTKTVPGNPVKTGFAIISNAEKSSDAVKETGLAQMDTTAVAVTVDNSGKIVKCFIDGIQTKVNFSDAGKIVTSLDTKFKTKMELGTDYGMEKVSSIKKEWSQQAAALSDYVQGKTVEQVKGIAVNEKGVPTSSELSSSVTISIASYINAIEKAVANAQDIGSKASDKLGLGAATNIAKSKDAGAEPGLAQAYSTYAIATFDANDKITSCIIDGSQTNVNFDSKGKITSDIKTVVKSKNELGTAYGMKKVSSIGKEWNEEAAAFAKYVTGKTAEEVMGIAVDEKGAPADAQLKSSVTVTIGDFKNAIEKAKANSK